MQGLAEGRGNGTFTIRLPEVGVDYAQDEEWFFLETHGSTRRVRIHDYAELYRVPGLYEALVYDTLECRSHERIANLLRSVLDEGEDPRAQASVLELGAGNGVVGAELKRLGIGKVAGLDLLEEARSAAHRDRPGVYDEYVVADLTEENPLAEKTFDGLVVVAALGFGDIPTQAFVRAVNLVRPGGWIALTIKSEFLNPDDESGFGILLRRMLQDRFAQLEAYQRFRHRISVGGEEIAYAALVARKLTDLPEPCERPMPPAPSSRAADVALIRPI